MTPTNVFCFYSKFGRYIKPFRSVDVGSFYANLRKKDDGAVDVRTLLNWLDDNWVIDRYNEFMSGSIHIRSCYW